MKKILEVVGRMDRAGQETFLMNVLRTHDPQKYEIWFSVNTDHIGDYEPEILDLGGKIWHNPYAITTKSLLPYLREFRNFLKREGPFDAVHCHVYYFGGFIMKIAREEGVAVRIMHSHSTSDGLKNTVYRRLYRWWCRKLILENATQLVACGKEAYEALFHRACPSNDKILNNAIVMNKFNLSLQERNLMRESLDIAKENRVIISVARFLPVKNHERIISIFDNYKKNVDSLSTLLLVGDGDGRTGIEDIVKERGLEEAVHFLGKRSDIPQLLNASDALLMPSLFEGLPVSLVEAQAAGVSCVISDVITSEVDMGLDLVHFVSLSDSDEIWATAIEKACNIEKPSFDARYDALNKNGYTIESTWRKLEELYE